MYERHRHALRQRLLPLVPPDPAAARCPRRMIGADPLLLPALASSAAGVPAALDFIEPQALADYERCFCRPEAIHAACEDYRAAAAIDLEHDRASRAAGERIACDTLVLWGERGVVARAVRPARAVAGAMQRRGQRPGRAGRPLHRRGTAGRDSAANCARSSLTRLNCAGKRRAILACAAGGALPSRAARGVRDARLADTARPALSRCATAPGCSAPWRCCCPPSPGWPSASAAGSRCCSCSWRWPGLRATRGRRATRSCATTR